MQGFLNTLPTLPKAYLSRSRLLDMMDALLSQKLLIISTPMGYGATSLAVDWCRRRVKDGTVAVAWLSGAQIKDQQDIDVAVMTLRKSADKALVVVIDNFDEIDETELMAETKRRMEVSPVYIHWLVITKTGSYLPIVYYQATGNGSVINALDLAFTRTEILEFMTLRTDRDLSKNNLRTIKELTGGWLTGLLLVAMALGTDEDIGGVLENLKAGKTPLIHQYLKEALAQLSSEDVSFLVGTSPIDGFSPPMVDYVLERTDSTFCIQTLQRFAYLSGDDRLFWHVPLFVKVLQQMLQVSPDSYGRILNRITDWYVAHNEFLPMLEHFIRFKLWDDLNANMSKDYRMLLYSGIEALLRGKTLGLDTIPTEAIAECPIILILTAVMFLNQDNYLQAEQLLFKADELTRSLCLCANYESKTLQRWIMILRTLAKGQSGDVIDDPGIDVLLEDDLSNDPYFASWMFSIQGTYYLRSDTPKKALMAYERSIDVAEKNENAHIMLVSSYLLSQLHVQSGRLARAEDVLLRARKAAEKAAHQLPDAGLMQIGLARISLAKGDTALAGNLLHDGEKQLLRNKTVGFYLDAQILLASVKMAYGEHDAARIILEKAVRHALAHNSKRIAEIAKCHLAYALARSGDLASLQQWLAEAELANATVDCELHRNRQLAKARTLISLGHCQEAIRIICVLLPQLRQTGCTVDLISANILLAGARSGQPEQRKEASEALFQATRLAASVNLLQPFIEEAQLLEPLLTNIEISAKVNKAPSGQQLIFFQKLAERLAVKDVAAFSASRALAALTDREREVCSLLVQGETYDAIAQKLFISKHTVHSHANSVYSKLGVAGRRELKTQLLAQDSYRATMNYL